MSLSLVAAEALQKLVEEVGALDIADRAMALNAIRAALHAASPFRMEPVDCVLWVPAREVEGNDYNPNRVAPPELRLLELSIRADGYTQPIVTAPDEGARRLVIDGFHRNRVGRESIEISSRVFGHLPVVTINSDRGGRADRIAATVRHNRARGKHGVEAMSRVVVELARRNWSDERIGRELGMEPDEVLRLKQVSGLAEMFANRAFSEAWEVTSE